MDLNSFLAELFPPAPPTAFDQRFAGGGPDPTGGMGGGATPMAYDAPSAPSQNPLSGMPPGGVPLGGGGGGPIPPPAPVPLPTPRPDITSALAGQPSGGPPMGAPPMAPPPPSGMDINARLAGPTPMMPGAPPQAAPDAERQSLIGRLAGLDPAGDKRLRSTIAGGFKDANPAFAGGAFMKGAGGGVTGGLASDKEDAAAATAASDKAQTQSNFNRTQGDKELTSDALRKLYGVRGAAMTADSATRATGTGKGSWNKPASERWKDAQKLIIDKNKEIDNSLNVLGMPKADRDKATADARAQKDMFKRQTLNQYGLNEDGSEVPQRSDVPSTSKVIGDKEAKASGLYDTAGTYDDPHMPQSKAEFDALPAGSIFINPADGKPMAKRAAE